MLEGKKVVLAYSGGLDTSVCLKWLEQQGAIALRPLPGPRPGRACRRRARRRRSKIGAVDAFVRDAKDEFVEQYVAPAIKANALYGGKYPLFTALGRPAHRQEARRGRTRGRGYAHRARLDGQGQRPGPLRRDDGLHSAGPHRRRAGARLEHEPPGGDGLRRGARHPRPDHQRIPLQRGRRTSGDGPSRPGRWRTRTTSRQKTSSSSPPPPRRRPTCHATSSSASRRVFPSASTAKSCGSSDLISELNVIAGRARRGTGGHGRRPPRRHKEPRDLRGPGRPHHHPGPQGT